MHNFKTNYDKILEVLNEIEPKDNFIPQIRKPKMNDKKLIAIGLVAEYMSIDSECQLFRILPRTLSSCIERSVYNRRKRKLFKAMNLLRLKLVEHIDQFENCYIVDSMPLEVCKLSRSSRSTICKEKTYSSPNRGYCASQSMSYYGYKLHAVCSIKGVIGSLDISPASVHDIHFLKDIRNQMEDCTILADKGYLSASYQLDLFQKSNIRLETPMRRNQKNYRDQPYIFKKSRKRIETIFSQLCDQFMIRRNYAKTFDGFKTRILTKITAMTVIQYINKFHFNRNVNNLKINIT
ncbi:MAG: IS982 family transposase [Alkalibacterium sp.]|nr:IS982 family transposase [Alkalibacterium sp.]